MCLQAADVVGVDGALTGGSATRDLLVRMVPNDGPGVPPPVITTASLTDREILNFRVSFSVFR